MATKNDFTQEEWALLRDTPHVVAMAVAVAGASGFFGSIKEALTSAGAIVEGLKGDNCLLQAVCSLEEIKAGQKALRSGLQPSDIESLRHQLKTAATEKADSAVTLLSRKGFSEDLESYRSFLTDIGTRVAKAAKEGGFLGFGGERVSEGERELLAQLDAVLRERPV